MKPNPLASLQSTRTLGVEVLVIGAVARDILIRHLLGARPERTTKDVDGFAEAHRQAVVLAGAARLDADAEALTVTQQVRGSERFG